jgi:hypothetical protein
MFPGSLEHVSVFSTTKAVEYPMKKFLFAATLLGAVAFSSSAMAADPVVDSDEGFFGSIMGSYTLGDVDNEWRLWGPGAPPEANYVGLGDGLLGRAILGYRWSDWDMAVAGQYGDFSDSEVSTDGIGNDGYLSAEHWAVDAQLGYNTVMGDTDVRMALGVRYAVWNNDVEVTGGRGVHHDFEGIGPMAEFTSSSPLGDSMTFEVGAGASILFGEIETDGSGGWNCTDCNDEKVTAYSLTANLGLGFNLTDNARAILGWQVEWWDNVNVETTDNSLIGLNEGESGHLLTGPYLAIAF